MDIVIQSVTSLGYIPRDYRKKFKKIGIRGKEAVRVIKKVQMATFLQSLELLEKRSSGAEYIKTTRQQKNGRVDGERRKVEERALVESPPPSPPPIAANLTYTYQDPTRRTK